MLPCGKDFDLLMNLLILGCGKTGALVADVARARRHQVQVLSGAENVEASALTPEALAPINAVIDFTTPAAVLANAEACIRARKNFGRRYHRLV